MVNSKPPCPRTGNHGAPIQETLNQEAMATQSPDGACPLGAGLALAKPASRARFIAASPWIAANPSMAQGPIP